MIFLKIIIIICLRCISLYILQTCFNCTAISTLTLTLTLKIVYLDTTDILQLNYYIQHIGNKKICRLCQGDHIKTYGCRYHMTT